MADIKLNELTPEQKEALMAELETEQKQRANKVKEQREGYKKLVNDVVTGLFPVLQAASEHLRETKTNVFDALQEVVKAKSSLYNRKQDQGSHTFSSEDGNISITVGYNIMDGWDDTANVGITKVNDYIQSLISDKVSQVLVDSIMQLLAKDAKGNLKASRVLKLKQIADKTQNKDFIDAIQIIQDAYKPVRSKEYVRCEFKGESGEKVILPLSITDAAFIDKKD